MPPSANKLLGVLENGYIVFAARIFLGFIMLLASIDKIGDPNAFATSISHYKLVGSTLALVIATILPWLELLCGLFLIFGIMRGGSSLLTLIMLAIFTAGVISGIARGLDISCGCFTRDPNVDKIGWLKVLENCGLILLSLYIYFSGTNKFSILTTTNQISDDNNDSLS